MSYISTEDVATKRKEIKTAFPNWKFSITREHYSSLNVVILEADIKLTDKENVSVNQYYIKEHYADNKEVRDALQSIVDIMMRGKKTVSTDGDYGNIPNFYVNLEIGKWNKPFVFKRVKL
ncbi:MAG TPA: LPD29 domain-containing protein [Nitrosopumilaceae archaeon]|jgi:hypothetical protein|nr:LPD29 domain-containing protein [Nitrosopumilaceae archaeon]